MRVGLFKRVWAFLLDIIPIFFIISLAFNLFAGDLLKPQNFDSVEQEYQEHMADFSDVMQPYIDQYDDGLITEEDYQIVFDTEKPAFDDKVDDLIPVIMRYYTNSISYYFISFNAVFYLYNLLTKGKTLGRKVAKIEFAGKVNWWTLLIREVVWKSGFWVITLGGGLLLDIAMIGLGKRKQSLRDMVSPIRVTYEGVDYPF